MKKAIILIMVGIMTLSLGACGSKSSETSSAESAEASSDVVAEESSIEKTGATEEYRLGDSVETDILKITLVNAELAIKLNATSTGTYEELKSGNMHITSDYFTADEYDASEDTGKAYVAAKGHTYVVFEYNAENLDRASVDFDGPFSESQFMTVEYKNQKYNGKTNYGACSKNGYEWEKYSSSNVLLKAGTNQYMRGYIDIETDADSLDDEFELILSLPNSDGTTSDFRFVVSADDRTEQGEAEISVEEAMYSFFKEEGQEYFKNHLDNYATLSADEISRDIIGHKWTVNKKEKIGTWSGKYMFESGGGIEETLYDGSVGHFNNHTWKLDGDNLIISDKSYEVREIQEGAYLLVLDGNPSVLLQ